MQVDFFDTGLILGRPFYHLMVFAVLTRKEIPILLVFHQFMLNDGALRFVNEIKSGGSK